MTDSSGDDGPKEAGDAARLAEAEAEIEGLREAMRMRATIEQAKGILMAIRGITPEEAFDILSIQSQNENVKLSAISQRIVDSVAARSSPEGELG